MHQLIRMIWSITLYALSSFIQVFSLASKRRITSLELIDIDSARGTNCSDGDTLAERSAGQGVVKVNPNH